MSAGGSDELERLNAAIAEDPRRASSSSPTATRPQVLAALRSLDGEAGAAVSGYLDLVGYRLLDGFDISEPPRARAARRAAALDPHRASRAARPTTPTSTSASPASARKVPEEHRAEFDELLGEARLMYRLRDERGVYSDIWASGLMRRAALAAGRRLAAGAASHDPEHMRRRRPRRDVRAASPARAGRRPTSSRRAPSTAPTHSAKDAPPFLGAAAAAAARPVRACRRGVGRLMRATGIALGSLFGSSEAEHEEDVLRGLAASPGVYEGPARRVSGPSEFGRIVAGRRARHRVDDRGVQHPAAAARRDRHRQRRPALALGDRRARVRHPRRGRDARGDRAHRRRRRACASTATAGEVTVLG